MSQTIDIPCYLAFPAPTLLCFLLPASSTARLLLDERELLADHHCCLFALVFQHFNFFIFSPPLSLFHIHSHTKLCYCSSIRPQRKASKRERKKKTPTTTIIVVVIIALFTDWLLHSSRPATSLTLSRSGCGLGPAFCFCHHLQPQEKKNSVRQVCQARPRGGAWPSASPEASS